MVYDCCVSPERGHGGLQKVKALNKRAEEKYPLLKDVCGKDGTAVIKKKIMMLFVNASKREDLHSSPDNNPQHMC